MYPQYAQNPMRPSTIRSTTKYVAEPLEKKITRWLNNKDEINDQTVDLIYTERKEGILAAYDIRTDKWELAVEASDKVAQSYHNRREQKIGESTYDTMTPEQQEQFNKDFPQNKHAIKAAQQQ